MFDPKTTNHTVIKNNSYMIKNDLLTIKNDQSVSSDLISGSDQKRSMAMIKNAQQNKESNKVNNNKSNSSTGPAIQDKDAGSLSFNERAALAHLLKALRVMMSETSGSVHCGQNTAWSKVGGVMTSERTLIPSSMDYLSYRLQRLYVRLTRTLP